MKNLKKVLSLVLALAMALSLMTVAFAAVPKASSLTGYSNTKYAEAVDVMVGLGVIDGVSGDLQAQGNVTREQAAKIICTMLMGSNASSLSTTSKYFSDVPTTRWSAPYIAYCVEKGIVSGVGGGKYNPTGNVTGNQFAKMLLVALGYDADIQGYKGTNWAVNVSSDAAEAGIFSGNTSANKNVAATREEACLYAFNTLKATMVKYENKGTTITIGNANVVVGASTASPVTGMAYDYRGATGTYGTTQQFCEKYFYNTDANGAKLTYTTSDDAMMRPAHQWYYGSIQNTASKIGNYQATPIVTYTATTLKTKALGDLGVLAGTEMVQYTNGAAKQVVAIAAADTILNGTGNGTMVEIYKVDDATTTVGTTYNYRECITKYTFAKATVKSYAATAAKGAYTEYTLKDTTATAHSYDVFTSTVTSGDTSTAVVTGTVANGDYVVYYVDKNSTAHIEAITTKSGTVSALTNLGVYTVDGNAMQAAAAMTANYNQSGLTAPSVATKAQTFYVDNYGYILGAVTNTTKSYAMVVKVGTSATLDGTTLTIVPVATLAYADGTVKTVMMTTNLGVLQNGSDAATMTAANALAGKVVTYVDNAKGTYIADATSATVVTSVTAINPLSNTLVANTAYASSNTLFVYVDYSSATGSRAVTGTVTLKTGIANAGNMTSLTKTYAVDTDVTADKVANVVFVYDDTTATTTSNYVYLTGNYTQTSSTVYAWDAYVAGAKTSINVTNTTGLTEGLYKSVVVGASGATLTSAVALSTESNGTTLYKGVKVSGGLLFLTTNATDYTVADATACFTGTTALATIAVGSTVPVYDINTTNNTVTTTNAGELTTSVEGTVYIAMNSTNTAIAAIYVYHA